jgi:hypothetical protein
MFGFFSAIAYSPSVFSLVEKDRESIDTNHRAFQEETDAALDVAPQDFRPGGDCTTDFSKPRLSPYF